MDVQSRTVKNGGAPVDITLTWLKRGRMDARGEVDEPSLGIPALRRFHAIVARLSGGHSLARTLQLTVDGVVAELGFQVAGVYIAAPDGWFEAVAVAGPGEACEQMLGRRFPPDAYEAIAAGSGSSGHEPVSPENQERPDHLDAGPCSQGVLVAPLRTFTGQLFGVLSVECPDDTRPSCALRDELVQMYAAQAGAAIYSARLSEALDASDEAFRLAFEGAGVGMTIISLNTDDPGRILRANQSMAEITGYTVEELTLRTFAEITHPDDRGRDLVALARLLSDGEAPPVYRTEKRYVRPDGSSVWVHLTTTGIRLAPGGPLHGVTQIEDITARRTREADLRFRAAHDDLTGLANRTTITQALSRLLEEGLARRRDDGVHRLGALLFCDLDGFKPVNDTHGHDVGDLVLQAVANRLRDQVRPQDLVARLGGDEFVVLTPDLDLDGANRLAARLEAVLATPIEVNDLSVMIGISIGVARLPSDTNDPNAVLRSADLAMYEVKSLRRNPRKAVDDAN